MNRRRAVQVCCGLVSLALMVPMLLHESCVTADDRDGTKAEVKAEGKKERAKPRGRLPAYFSTVVSPEQRERVYSIQARYGKQIEDLQRQINELLMARNKDVDGVLQPEQLERVNAKRADAKARRAARLKKAAEAKSGS